MPVLGMTNTAYQPSWVKNIWISTSQPSFSRSGGCLPNRHTHISCKSRLGKSHQWVYPINYSYKMDQSYIPLLPLVGKSENYHFFELNTWFVHSSLLPFKRALKNKAISRTCRLSMTWPPFIKRSRKPTGQNNSLAKQTLYHTIYTSRYQTIDNPKTKTLSPSIAIIKSLGTATIYDFRKFIIKFWGQNPYSSNTDHFNICEWLNSKKLEYGLPWHRIRGFPKWGTPNHPSH